MEHSANLDFSSSERFIVETPENVKFDYQVAGIGSRFLAILIDSLLQGAIYVFLFLLLVILSTRTTSFDLPPAIYDYIGVAVLLVLFIIQFGYFMFFEIIWAGQTPGKRLFGLRVTKDNGYPLHALDSVIRNVIRIIDFFPIAYGIGLVTMFFNDRAKRLGDYAAGTLVVKTRANYKLTDFRQIESGASLDSDLPGVERIPEADIEMVESFLRRRGELANADALAAQLAAAMRERMGSAPDSTPINPAANLHFLKSIVRGSRSSRT